MAEQHFRNVEEVLPKFDPVSKQLSVDEWIEKIEEYGDLYQWDDIAWDMVVGGNTGHISRACPTTNRDGRRSGQAVTSTTPTETTRIRARSQPPAVLHITEDTHRKYYKDALINGHLVKCYIDLGSSVVALRRDVADELQLTYHETTLDPFVGYGAGQVRPIGIFTANISIDTVETRVTVHVVPSGSLTIPLLVGHPYTEAEGVVILSRAGELIIAPSLDNAYQATAATTAPRPTTLVSEGPYVIPRNYLGHVTVRSQLRAQDICVEGGLRAQTLSIPRCIVSTNSEGLAVLPVLNVTDAPITVREGETVARGETCKEGEGDGNPSGLAQEVNCDEVTRQEIDTDVLGEDTEKLRAINTILGSLRFDTAIAYLDDIIIPSGDVEEGLQRLQHVFDLLRANGLRINLKKCHYLKREIEYLGWGVEQKKAFEEIKQLLSTRPVLTIYQHGAETEVHTDACAAGLGGVLLQKQSDNTWRPVSYFSRKTTPEEAKYHSYELEALAIVCALEKFRVYLIEFDYTLQYHTGKQNQVADALSRNPAGEAEDTTLVGLQILGVHMTIDWIAAMQRSDAEILRVRDALESGFLHPLDKGDRPFQSVHVDHLGPLPVTERDKKYVAAAVCGFSKYVVLKAVEDVGAASTIRFVIEFMSHYGKPMCIITDRRTAFTAKSFAEFCSEHDVQHVKIATGTPRANGQIEKINNVILNCLATSTRTITCEDWDEKLYEVQWAINSSYHRVTRRTPHEIVFNYKISGWRENPLTIEIRQINDELGTEEEKRDVSELLRENEGAMERQYDTAKKQKL
ncbi:uncharacterized protein LOC143354602 [Halictus rubicundus]|uniref:uncharacterized protein LOC143354602 n=1 Tax=Halictus rubicundus TaxID=77578 RepID=UPI0040373963